MKKSTGKKDVPNLPASSRMQMPSGTGASKTGAMKVAIKGGTKTKMK
jgi:hypothetical protein